jgi:PAS domain S-box-containing protein
MSDDAPRVLLLDDDAVTRRVVGAWLERAGYRTTAFGDAQRALHAAQVTPPEVILLDLMLPDTDGYAVLRALRSTPEGRDVPVIVLTAMEGDDEVARVFAAGADDFLRKPCREAELLARIRAQLRLSAYVHELAAKERDARAMVELTRTLASRLDPREILFTVVRRVAELVRVDRCSIVVGGVDDRIGFVVAASDDASLHNLPVELDRYPEVRRVLRSGAPLVIEDSASHPLLEEVRGLLSGARLTSLTLLPIVCDGRALGVLFLRARGRRGTLDARESALCEVIANATGVALRNASELQQLREQSQAVSRARQEAERRARFLERYADLFVSAADGMVVIDPSGQVLFANPRAAEITGYDDADLRRAYAHFIVTRDDRGIARSLRANFRRRVFPSNVDLRIRRRDGELRTLALSTSSLHRDDHAVLLTFRDVTDDRATARELARTKEFLTSLIEGTPDAIIAASLDGTVLLFNQAAERVLGYPRESVLGQRAVERLYPPGAARDLMGRLRASPKGLLDGVRSEVIARDGERIPVQLSVALVGAPPTATVGIFSDLRERLKLENRLERAQQELAVSERQVLVGEVAGAAAHELNQPLTAVQGYAELIGKCVGDPATVARASGVILRETERMAEIVRRLGNVQRYETRDYVGGARILDLGRSADDG